MGLFFVNTQGHKKLNRFKKPYLYLNKILKT